MKSIDTALSSINEARSNLGAMQNRLEYTAANLTTSTENLTAAESRIRDVDVAKEMVTLSKLNILNQASQAMVSQAKQQPESCFSIIKIILNLKLRGKAYALLFIFKFDNYKGEEICY